ncbi:MAG: ribosome small subunit-dependent GTPase A [Pseudomonadota bacterium]
MIRDYSKFLPHALHRGGSDHHTTPLERLGWQPFFAKQASVEELAETPPARIVEVHRNAVHVTGENVDETIPPLPDATIGDWVLINRTRPQSSRVLERKSLVKRRAPGTDRQVQLIAANIDAALIVSSCNQDFNIARLERYIALAFEAGIKPMIVLTKADLVTDTEDFVDRARTISDLVPVVALDARGDEPNEKLKDWCRPGQTIVLLGSSGVGKSTLANALLGVDLIDTQGIREDDAKGRHTTTRRQLHLVPGGCIVLDTPGMRELQLTDAASGIDDVFSDIRDLSAGCRFKDCQHQSEPDCSVRQAIESGEVDERRLARWRKLNAEEAFNSASLAERRKEDKAFGKMVRQIKKQKTRKDWS